MTEVRTKGRIRMRTGVRIKMRTEVRTGVITKKKNQNKTEEEIFFNDRNIKDTN